jgi:hypothetical protein
MDKTHKLQLAADYYTRTGNREVPAKLAAEREWRHRGGAILNGKPVSSGVEALRGLGLGVVTEEPSSARMPSSHTVRSRTRARRPRAIPGRTRGSRRGFATTASSRDGPSDEPGPGEAGDEPHEHRQNTQCQLDGLEHRVPDADGLTTCRTCGWNATWGFLPWEIGR